MMQTHDALGPIRWHFGGGVALREFHLEPRGIIAKHRHEHAHLSYLAAGTVLVATSTHDDPAPMDPAAWAVRELTGPCAVEIPAGTWHMIQAVTPVVWACIHQEG